MHNFYFKILFVNNPHDCSYLAVVAGLCGEADYIFIPEDPPSADWPQRLCKQLSQARSSIPIHNIFFYKFNPFLPSIRKIRKIAI